MNLDDICKLINIDHDNKIVFNGAELVNINSRSIQEIKMWLYKNVHIQSLEKEEVNNDLNREFIEKINLSLPDKFIDVKPNIKIKQGLYELNGIRLFSDNENIKISCKRPNISPGFYSFIKNNLSPKNNNIDIIRYYIGFEDASVALKAWIEIVNFLDKMNINFSTKILSNPIDYPRTDSIVIYIPKKEDYFENDIVDIISKYIDNTKKDYVSPFCHQIFNNISKSYDPILIDNRKESFGENRCRVLATSIKQHFNTNINFKYLLKLNCLKNNIDINDFSKNLKLKY